jgi:hypothetical protein
MSYDADKLKRNPENGSVEAVVVAAMTLNKIQHSRSSGCQKMCYSNVPGNKNTRCQMITENQGITCTQDALLSNTTPCTSQRSFLTKCRILYLTPLHFILLLKDFMNVVQSNTAPCI